MCSDINALRKAYYEFLSEDMSYSELQRSYDNINNNIRAKYNDETVREKEQNIKFNSKEEE